MNDQLYVPFEEEGRIQKELRAAKGNRSEVRRIRRALVTLYVRYGESFKMNKTPNDQLAEKYLKKALKFQAHHPVANYRLAHLLFKKEDYTAAIHHFQLALNGERDGKLNETQQMIAHMFMATAGVQVARHASGQLASMEFDADLHYQIDKVESYRKQLEVPTEDMLKRIYYRKVTPEESKLISEETYERIFDEAVWQSSHVLLMRNDDGYEVRYGSEYIPLETTAFTLLYHVLVSAEFLTNEKLIQYLNGYELATEYKESTIRRIFSRLQERIPFWQDIIDTGNVGRKVGRKRKEGLSYCILCRASDVLPDEVFGERE